MVRRGREGSGRLGREGCGAEKQSALTPDRRLRCLVRSSMKGAVEAGLSLASIGQSTPRRQSPAAPRQPKRRWQSW